MMDKISTEQRSLLMAKIKSKDTKIEMIVRKYIHSKGLRYKLHDKDLPGKPDLVFPKYRSVVFINGCFWHGHRDCKVAHIPRSRTEYWSNKIRRNIVRDEKNYLILTDLGWKVHVVWECELKMNPDIVLEKLIKELREYELPN